LGDELIRSPASIEESGPRERMNRSALARPGLRLGQITERGDWP
jgi:hypothetical protein